MSGYRLPRGGLVDRARPLAFRFDGRPYRGLAGDSLASALIASGVSVVGRSFKLHRPRGILGAGHEEPNALVTLGSGAHAEPNVKATTVELHDGLEAWSQNRWPSLAVDLMAVNGFLKPVFAAGFYYKTFMWPAAFWEKVYEPLIRRAAGLGRASGLPDPGAYERVRADCDLLVVGAGPAGLMAALSAARGGARVILAEDDTRLGGQLLSDRARPDDLDGPAFAERIAAELASLPNVRILTRTTVTAAFDHGTYLALERTEGGRAATVGDGPRLRLLEIVAEACVLAAGATERPLVFPDNDRPGVMLSTAVSTYLNRYGVAAGRQAVVATATDAGWQTARDLLTAGVTVAAVADTRGGVPAGFEDVGAQVAVFPRAVVAGVSGRMRVSAVSIRHAGGVVRVPCDLVVVSGGFNPSVQLAAHFGVRPVYDEAIGAFRMTGPVHGIHPSGAAAGLLDTRACLEDGLRAAAAALDAVGKRAGPVMLPSLAAAPAPRAGEAFFKPGSPGSGKAFVDLQHDVTAADVELAHREGYRSVEHLKRYTTLGMATDQGRTANVDGLALMAALQGVPIAQAGVTLSRPPVTPLPIGAVAGHRRGAAFRPVRRVPVHRWAEARGAVFLDTGLWKRPQYFPLPGETDWLQTVNREVTAVRSGVGVTDVSTLGKIEIDGPDAARFLDLVYANRPSRIPVGRSRYCLMLREDGFVLDDGTVARFAEDRFLASVSTAHAAAVWRHMLFCRQVLWPELDVALAAVTDVWAQFAIAGPLSPAVVGGLLDTGASDGTRLQPMTAHELTVCGGVPARLAAVSFSGERAFELAVPADRGEAVLSHILAAGAVHGIVPYGTEAMGVMRIEKGHPAGAELNGQTTAHDLGLGRMLARDKDHVGRVLSQRPALTDPGRPRLVGLTPLDGRSPIRGGAHVLPRGAAATAENDQGYVTSSAWSPTVGTPIALALVAHGPERHGEEVQVWDGIRGAVVAARIGPACFVDPDGDRIHGG